ncbi:Mbov_0401 family ICE element transposase-like protein [Mycoplasmopsis arginini]|uniref:Mbov_0401 family ICE element transposase-like protein n=1 Tax=Mycoplasmopsis arginini TaxID=2094 RepID=UPI002735B4FB|nr:integrative conjugal element protein [Mycoplasmopsis arginini]MDP4042919.1 integrative conjugal element protein [Mycoplasmopsis arginini]
MEFQIDIFNDNFDFMKELYQQKVNEINKQEEDFRTNLRFKLHPNWKIARRLKRQWITFAGIFFLNLTMYEYIDQKTQKKIRITYYHNEKLRELSTSKYDKDIIKFCIKNSLENIPDPRYLKKYLPSKQLLNLYIKKWKIQEQIEEKNRELISEKNNNFSKLNEDIFLEIDDLFIKHKQNFKLEKMRVREVILHTKNCFQNRNILCMFFTKNINEKTTKNNDLNYVINKVKEQLESINLRDNNIIINGDGARWMYTISDSLNAIFNLDYFHIKKQINNTFSFNKFATKINKKYFKNWLSSKYKLPWNYLFAEAIDIRNFNYFYDIFENLNDEIPNKDLPFEIKKNIKTFWKYIISNARSIFDNPTIKNSSYTEHFVYHTFKRHIKKPHARFGFKTIKMKIIYKNVQNGLGTIIF